MNFVVPATKTRNFEAIPGFLGDVMESISVLGTKARDVVLN